MMSTQQTEPTAIVFVSLATVALAFKGIFAKFAYMAGIGVDGLLLLRFGLAVPLFWLGVYFLARRTTPLTWLQWKGCMFAGFMFFFATYCDFTAIDKIGVSVSRLILFTFPMIVMLINAVMDRQMPSLHQWMVFVTTYFGISLVMMPGGVNSFDAFDWVGASWALGSAVTYAIYLITSQEIMKSLGSVRFTAASGSVTLAMMLVFIPLITDVQNISFPAEGVFWSAAIAVFCTVVPFFLLFEGIKRCGATQASLITLSGPVLTVLLAWLFLEETLTSVQILGAAITIFAVASLKSNWVFQHIRRLFKMCWASSKQAS